MWLVSSKAIIWALGITFLLGMSVAYVIFKRCYSKGEKPDWW